MARKKAAGAQTPENTHKAHDRRKDAKITPAMAERQWKPGVSGNPGGRPKSVFRAAYLNVLDRLIPGDKEGRTYADVIAEKVVAEAAKGKIEALRELADRVDGRPMQAIALGGEGGGPIPLEFRSPEERQLRIQELLAKAKGGSMRK